MIAQTAPELFSKTKQEWVQDARFVAQKLLSERPSITIRDVLEVHPLPGYIKKNVLGNVFLHAGIFQKVGVERSNTRASHGHFIHRWTLKPELYERSYFRYKRRDVEEDGRGD